MTAIKAFFTDKTVRIIEISLLILVGIALFIVFGRNIKSDLKGDGHEYALMLESFRNHGTPDLQPEDVISANLVYGGSDSVCCNLYFAALKGFCSVKQAHMASNAGYYGALNGKLYCYHFWSYSLMALPVKLVIEAFGGNESKALQSFNVLLFVSVLAYILFLFKAERFVRYLVAGLFFFSANFFYLVWIHPEIFSSTLLFLGFLLLMDKRHGWSALVIALASTQNPPIAFYLPLVALAVFLEHGFDIKRLATVTALGMLCLVPPVFYYANFGVTNLIIHFGFVDPALMGFDRFISLFFDLNQGMIYAIPLILILTPVFFVIAIRDFERKNLWMYLVPVFGVLVVLPGLQQNNWNAGCAVICRYALWCSVPFTIFFVLAFNWDKLKNKIFAGIIILSQVVLLMMNGWHHPDGGDYVELSVASRYMLDNHPSWYNPDPEIFCERVLNEEGDYKSKGICVYANPQGEIRKVLLCKGAEDSLKSLAIPRETVDKAMAGLTFNKRGYTYLNFSK